MLAWSNAQFTFAAAHINDNIGDNAEGNALKMLYISGMASNDKVKNFNRVKVCSKTFPKRIT